MEDQIPSLNSGTSFFNDLAIAAVSLEGIWRPVVEMGALDEQVPPSICHCYIVSIIVSRRHGDANDISVF